MKIKKLKTREREAEGVERIRNGERV